jgi:hypothetical protein
VSFQLGATVGKAADVKKAFEAGRKTHLEQLPTAFEDSEAGREGARVADTQRGEIEGLSDAGIKAAEALVRGMPGSTFQVNISGNQDPSGTSSLSVSVNAIP